ncbi:Metalloprotease [Daedaleopsis nitida]|nr:Metalloprotease [Daedaleopsis nitida]
MFSIALVTLAISGALTLATPAKRAPALEVSLKAPTEVHSIDDIKVTAAVTNTGSETLKVLKYGTILDNEFATRSFSVNRDGTAANFTGVKLQVDLKAAGDSAYVVIPAGESITVEHDVAPLYNFEALGTGAFEFEPVTAFRFVESQSIPKVSTKKTMVNVKTDVKKRELKTVTKRAHTACSDKTKSGFISSSYSEGQSLASIAADYVSKNGADDKLFKSYFSTGSSVAKESSSDRTLNCEDPYNQCQDGVIAYTLTKTTNIYFCDVFYEEVETKQLCGSVTVNDRKIRGGTTLHELTHAVAGTEDVGYGCEENMQLSPDQALMNADSYNCFSTQVYQNTQC